MSHMHEPRLHVALHPARPLAQPVPEAAVRFLVGGGINHRGGEVVAGQAHAEVRVFRDVVRIPGADRTQLTDAEVIRRAAERNWRTDAI